VINSVMLYQALSRVRGIASLAIDPRSRAFHRQRRVTSISEREAAADIIAAMLPRYPAPAPMGDELRRDGLAFVPPVLSAAQIAEARAFLAGKLTRDPYRHLAPFRGPDEAPTGSHVASYDLADVLDCPHLLEAANDPHVLAIAAGYLGAWPTLSALRVWWSLPHGEAAQHTELFHRDSDDLRFLKLFVYLTDVDAGSGPHVFVEGSHRANRLTALRRFTDAEVTVAFGSAQVKVIAGEAGTSFLEATYGLHRGLPPCDRPRLVFQPLYTLQATIYSPKRPLRALRAGEKIDGYTSRLFVHG
jgi:hypothetical protein